MGQRWTVRLHPAPMYCMDKFHTRPHQIHFRFRVILEEMMDFEASVKLNIYETIARSTKMPTSSDVALAIDSSVTEVEEAFQRLYEKRLLVLEPGSTSHIRMAPPFSGIETGHRVRIEDKVYFANCAWDAFGI